MFLNPRALAVEGVGFGHRVLAVLGTRWFDVEVILPPYGGGGLVDLGPAVYPVTIIVRRGNKQWRQTITISAGQIVSFERITARFRGIVQRVTEILASLNNIIKESTVVKILRRKE